MGDIGVVGRSLGLYDVFVGGDLANTRFNVIHATSIPFEQIVPVLRPLLTLWRDCRDDGEAFGDVYRRFRPPELGSGRLVSSEA